MMTSWVAREGLRLSKGHRRNWGQKDFSPKGMPGIFFLNFIESLFVFLNFFLCVGGYIENWFRDSDAWKCPVSIKVLHFLWLVMLSICVLLIDWRDPWLETHSTIFQRNILTCGKDARHALRCFVTRREVVIKSKWRESLFPEGSRHPKLTVFFRGHNDLERSTSAQTLHL